MGFTKKGIKQKQSKQIMPKKHGFPIFTPMSLFHLRIKKIMIQKNTGKIHLQLKTVSLINTYLPH